MWKKSRPANCPHAVLPNIPPFCPWLYGLSRPVVHKTDENNKKLDAIMLSCPHRDDKSFIMSGILMMVVKIEHESIALMLSYLKIIYSNLTTWYKVPLIVTFLGISSLRRMRPNQFILLTGSLSRVFFWRWLNISIAVIHSPSFSIVAEEKLQLNKCSKGEICSNSALNIFSYYLKMK